MSTTPTQELLLFVSAEELVYQILHVHETYETYHAFIHYFLAN